MKNWTLWIISLVLAGAICSCGQQGKKARVANLPYFDDPYFTPKWLTQNSDSIANFHAIQTFQLTNQYGQPITRSTVAGKVYVANFFFTGCAGICPKMTTNLLTVQQAFIDQDDLLILSHSVTPTKDSVPVLLDHAQAKGAIKDKWHMLTGGRSEIYQLGRSKYMVEQDWKQALTEEDFLHTENAVLVDRNGRIRGIYNTLNKTDIQQLIGDATTLLKE